MNNRITAGNKTRSATIATRITTAVIMPKCTVGPRCPNMRTRNAEASNKLVAMMGGPVSRSVARNGSPMPGAWSPDLDPRFR